MYKRLKAKIKPLVQQVMTWHAHLHFYFHIVGARLSRPLTVMQGKHAPAFVRCMLKISLLLFSKMSSIWALFKQPIPNHYCTHIPCGIKKGHSLYTLTILLILFCLFSGDLLYADRLEPFGELDKELERHIKNILEARVLNIQERIELELQYFVLLDENLSRIASQKSGLTDNVLDILLTLTEEQHSQNAKELEKRWASFCKPDKELSTIIQFHKAQQRENALRTLASEDRYNRIAQVVNDVAQSSLLALTGNVPPLINTCTDIMLFKGSLTALSLRERKMMQLYRESLKEEDNHKKRQIIQHKIAKLQDKKMHALYKTWADEAALAEKEGDDIQALYYYQLADKTGIAAQKTHKRMASIQERIQQKTAAQQKTLFPQQKALGSFEQNDDIYAYIMTLIILDRERELDAALTQFITKYPENSLCDDMMLIKSSQKDRARQHEIAAGMLHQIIKLYPDSNSRYKAEWLLDNDDYNLYEAILKTKAALRTQKYQYVFFGEKFVTQNVLYGKRSAINRDVQFWDTLAIFNVFGIGSRLVGTMVHSPVSMMPLIDIAQRYLALYPYSLRSQQIYRLLADAYYQEESYEKSLYFYKKCGRLTKRKNKIFHNKIAEQLYAYARTRTRDDEKRYLLEYMIKTYPDAKIIPKVKKELEALASRNIHTISREWLYSSFDWFKQRFSCISFEWLDGRKDNKEFHSEAIRIEKNGLCTFNLFDKQGPCPQTVMLDPPVFEEVLLFSEQLQYEDMVYYFDQKTQERERELGYTRFPFAFTGSWDGNQCSLVPQLNEKKYIGRDKHLYQ